MPIGEPVTERQRMYVLQLLRQSYRPGTRVARADIPAIVGLHRHTVCQIRDQAAIRWLEEIERAERMADLTMRE